MKFYILFIITLFFIGCDNNTNKKDLGIENKVVIKDSTDYTNSNEVYSDFFELEPNRFRILDLEYNDSVNDRYILTNLGVSLVQPKNTIILDDESRKTFIDKSEYSKKFGITVDDIFIDNNSGFAFIVGSIGIGKNNLDSLIENMRSFNSLDEYSEEYYIINKMKAIQFRMLLDNTYILRIVFDDNTNGYLVLDYIFQENNIKNSLPKILESMSSVVFE